LYEKYRVERTDGKPVGAAIVLEFKDPIAKVGIRAWAEEMERHGYEQVAADVFTALANEEIPPSLRSSVPLCELCMIRPLNVDHPEGWCSICAMSDDTAPAGLPVEDTKP
jgi:hypothetical protein